MFSSSLQLSILTISMFSIHASHPLANSMFPESVSFILTTSIATLFTILVSLKTLIKQKRQRLACAVPTTLQPWQRTTLLCSPDSEVLRRFESRQRCACPLNPFGFSYCLGAIQDPVVWRTPCRLCWLPWLHAVSYRNYSLNPTYAVCLVRTSFTEFS